MIDSSLVILMIEQAAAVYSQMKVGCTECGGRCGGVLGTACDKLALAAKSLEVQRLAERVMRNESASPR